MTGIHPQCKALIMCHHQLVFQNTLIFSDMLIDRVPDFSRIPVCAQNACPPVQAHLSKVKAPFCTKPLKTHNFWVPFFLGTA